MQDLSKFNKVIEALNEVVGQNTPTGGMETPFLCHYWSQETILSDEAKQLQTDIAKAMLDGKVERVAELNEKWKDVGKSKVLMQFKLIEKIPLLRGTKIVYVENAPKHPVMHNVEYLYISEDSVKLGLCEYEETDQKAKDAMGRDTAIIKLKLVKGIIDVKEGAVDWKGKVVREPRAYVTAISFKAMQVAGQIIRNEKEIKRKLYGFE